MRQDIGDHERHPRIISLKSGLHVTPDAAKVTVNPHSALIKLAVLPVL